MQEVLVPISGDLPSAHRHPRTRRSHGFPILTAEQAAALINHDQTVAFSGFTPAGVAKAIPLALAARATAEHGAGRHFQIGVLTGASTGPSLDGALAKADAITTARRDSWTCTSRCCRR